jgi:hypothetical protein
MIVVLPDLHGTPRVLQLDRRGVIELSRVIEDGSCAGEVPESSANEAFAHAWARLRGEVRHAKHFANLGAALHFYRFGNHGLPAAEAARIVRRVRAAGVATVPAGA